MTHSFDRLQGAKVLIYSHDTFGLGHLRRCRAIAHSLVDAYKGLSVLIISGSPIISRFDFKARVDFIRIPGVVKLRNGDYTSLALHIDLDQTLAIRSSIIQHTADIYAPDIFLVDKEPLGLRGEVAHTLRLLKLRGATNILGLRDVMDAPQALKAEWQRKEVIPALDVLYNEIWVYGDRSLYNPVQGIGMPDSSLEKMRYLGYTKRELPASSRLPRGYRNKSFLLVTTGGGGDGDMLVDWVIRAYELSAEELLPALIMLGPFMPDTKQREYDKRIRRIPKLQAKIFDSKIEALMTHASGVVAMGGYNTFCEILSFDQKALLVPRETPRMEQRIRAGFAVQRGLATMLEYHDFDNTRMMVDALKALPSQPVPSGSGAIDLLNGLKNVNQRVLELIDSR